jgi:hypothetical protein
MLVQLLTPDPILHSDPVRPSINAWQRIGLKREVRCCAFAFKELCRSRNQNCLQMTSA